MGVISAGFSNGAWACNSVLQGKLVSGVIRSTGSVPALAPTDYFIMASSIQTLSKCLFGCLCIWIPSHIVLFVANTGCVLFAALIMGLGLPSVNALFPIHTLFIICTSATFVLTFVIGVRGMGRWTKTATGLMTSASGAGACIFPFIMAVVSQTHTVSVFVLRRGCCLRRRKPFPALLDPVPARTEGFQFSITPTFNATKRLSSIASLASAAGAMINMSLKKWNSTCSCRQ